MRWNREEYKSEAYIIKMPYNIQQSQVRLKIIVIRKQK